MTQMIIPKIIRCYRYAIVPSDAQRKCIEKAARKARRSWNELVAALRYAEKEIECGRRGSIQSELINILLRKNITGVAAVKAAERAKKDSVSKEEAVVRNRIDQGMEVGKLKYSKNGMFLRKTSNRAMALAYAVESVEDTRKKKGGLGSGMAVALLRKFRDCCKLYIKCKRGRPKFKGFKDSISLQYQIHEDSLVTDGFVNLSAIAGVTCAKTPIILHRTLPENSKVKQLALTIRGQRMFAVFMLDIFGPEKELPMTGRTAGIDPGRKMALSLASLDGKTEVFNPPVARNASILKRLRRLQRKADRQLRKANPECFKENGTFKKGFRPKNKSRNMLETGLKVLKTQERIANARADYYHNTANQLLSEYDIIGVGKWRGKIRKKKLNRDARRKLQKAQKDGVKNVGHNKGIRAQSRKDYDHSISYFTAILKYKAGSKKIFDVQEQGTTNTCSCGAKTGPTGLDGLKIRKWTCSACGLIHDRDFHSARQIAERAKEMAAVSVDS